MESWVEFAIFSFQGTGIPAHGELNPESNCTVKFTSVLSATSSDQVRWFFDHRVFFFPFLPVIKMAIEESVSRLIRKFGTLFLCLFRERKKLVKYHICNLCLFWQSQIFLIAHAKHPNPVYFGLIPVHTSLSLCLLRMFEPKKFVCYSVEQKRNRDQYRKRKFRFLGCQRGSWSLTVEF